MKRAAILAAFGAMAACAPPGATAMPVATSAERLVVDGALDVALVPGSFVPEDCRLEYVLTEGDLERIPCVAYRIEVEPFADQPWIDGYLALAYAAGWTLTEEFGGIYYLDRPSQDECRLRLMIIPYTLYPMDHDRPVTSTQGISAIAFDHYRDPQCASSEAR